MKEYLQIREQKRIVARVTGLVLTIFVHAGVLFFCSFNGIKYIWPPPAESSFLLDFSETAEPIEVIRAEQPRSDNPDPDQPVQLAQKSESPEVSKEPNLTPEAKLDDFGDIPSNTPEPKEEPKLDPRASFPGMAKKDTSSTTPHSAEKSSDKFKAGQSDGNARIAATDGKPSAHLKGRSTVGSIPRPAYVVQESGTVVVSIWVDNYGNVTKAIAGAEGTTVTDNSLWAAARKAAMETHFNMEADAPALQEGTITYIFNLK